MMLSSHARWAVLGFSALASFGSCVVGIAASYASAFGSATGRGQSHDWQIDLSVAALVLVVVAAWVTRLVPPKHAGWIVFVPITVLSAGYAVAAIVVHRSAAATRAHADAAFAARRAQFDATLAPLSRDFECPDDEAYAEHAIITHDHERGVLVHFRWNDPLTDLWAEPVGRVVGETLEWFHGAPREDGGGSRTFDECVDAEGRRVRDVYRGVDALHPRREDYGLERFRLEPPAPPPRE